jgi:uncharacterized protein (TIGR03790 family)
LLSIGRARADQPLPPLTVVVYNKNVSASVDLARFYAQQRGIPKDHLVGLACAPDEEIPRDEYDNNIATPLRNIFAAKHWWTVRENGDQKSVTATAIRFVAVIKGVPLKIKATAPERPNPGDQTQAGPVGGRNEASVDSELSVLGNFSPQISGAVSNTYFQSYRPIADFPNAALLLVCRLDAPDAESVRRMITSAISAEKNGLWGRAYVDAAHNPPGGLQEGDNWMEAIHQEMHKVGIPVVYENSPEIFPDTYPMSECALYYGWYTGGIAGPFTRRDFRFPIGAIAVHIHSYSANTLRDPNANWVGPLIARGATASLGNVYEPYLHLTTHLDIFNDRLLHGFTFAESAYMGTPALSWMNVMVGDPLYRPYFSWTQIDAPREKSTNEWKTYHEFAVKNFERPAAEYRSMARQLAMKTRNGAILEDLGLMEAGDGNYVAATNYFQQAHAFYNKRDDILRSVMEEAEGWIRQKKSKRALDIVRNTLRVVPDAPASALLRKIEQDLTSPPPAAPNP